MDRKAIQDQRKKGYFIEATKKIIQEDGVDELTVKRIADLAGFAPGTMYNYFTDLNELLYACACDFWIECRDSVMTRIDGISDIQNKMVAFAAAYFQYFLDHPHVFTLMFLKDFSQFKSEPPASPEIAYIFKSILHEAVNVGLLSEKNELIVEDMLGSAIHGMLLFYLKRRTDVSREELLDMMKMQVEFVLGKR